MVNIVCGVLLALVSGVIASVPDVLVEDVVGKQAQTAFVFAEAPDFVTQKKYIL